MTFAINFTDDQANLIEALRQRLANRIGRPVILEQDSTDCGQHWAALCVQSLPSGSWGQPGPLVTFITGSGVTGDPEVIDSTGAPLDTQDGFAATVEVARVAALKAWRGMTSPHLAAVD